MKKIYLEVIISLLLLCSSSHGQVIISDRHFTIYGSEDDMNLDNLFDNDIQSTWNVDQNTAWLVVKPDESMDLPLNGYMITNHQTTGNTISVTVSGSVDSLTFVPIHTNPGLALSGSKRTKVIFPNDVYYPFIRIEYTTTASGLSFAAMRFLATGQLETFSSLNINAGATNVNGSFTGDNGIKWTYSRCRDGQAYGAEGKSLMMRGQDDSAPWSNMKWP